MSANLKPESRPGRKFFWVRFDHPATGKSVRVDLGNDLEDARVICEDLAFIINNRKCWKSRGHRALDGLHPIAVNAFYEPIEAEIKELRHETLCLAIESAKLQEECHALLAEIRWVVSQDRFEGLRRGQFEEHVGCRNSSFVKRLATSWEAARSLKRAAKATTASRGSRKEPMSHES